MSLDNIYVNPSLAKAYDQTCGLSIDRQYYLSLASDSCIDVLDLGCGSGIICNEFAAAGHRVVGVDPSSTMLDIGRQKQHGGKIDWVHEYAQNYKADKLFDLIIMTGHSFQTLLDDAYVFAMFKSVRSMLSQSGQFVFETRNPSLDWASEWRNDESIWSLDGSNIHRQIRILSTESEYIEFEERFEISGEVITSTSKLRFMALSHIEELLNNAELKVIRLAGDWHEAPFSAQHSPEMIFTCCIK